MESHPTSCEAIPMKMIVAIVRPEKVQAVKDALNDAGVGGMTISHVTGRGKSKGLVFTNRVGEFVVDEMEKVQITVVCSDDDAEKIIGKIRDTTDTGTPGDGRIFVLPVEESIKIRTGEKQTV